MAKKCITHTHTDTHLPRIYTTANCSEFELVYAALGQWVLRIRRELKYSNIDLCPDNFENIIHYFYWPLFTSTITRSLLTLKCFTVVLLYSYIYEDCLPHRLYQLLYRPKVYYNEEPVMWAVRQRYSTLMFYCCGWFGTFICVICVQIMILFL